MQEDPSLKSNKRLENSRAYNALSEKLQNELASDMPDEGEVFSILDLLLFSLETEENTYMGDIGLKISRAILENLKAIDLYLGKGLFRLIKLVFLSPFYLTRLIKNCYELQRNIVMCSTMVNSIKFSQLVFFVEKSGGTYETPVIQKWLNARSIKIEQKDWKKIVANT